MRFVKEGSCYFQVVQIVTSVYSECVARRRSWRNVNWSPTSTTKVIYWRRLPLSALKTEGPGISNRAFALRVWLHQIGLAINIIVVPNKEEFACVWSCRKKGPCGGAPFILGNCYNGLAALDSRELVRVESRPAQRDLCKWRIIYFK